MRGGVATGNPHPSGPTSAGLRPSAQRTRDIDRYAEFEVLGWRIIRVSGDMLRYRPTTIVERTRAAVRAAGAPV